MGSSKGGDSAAYYRQQDEQRAAAVKDGTARINDIFGQFDDAFYDQRRQAYMDFALPQLDDQRAKAARELTFALARSGNLQGSARAALEGDLGKQYDLQAQNLADQAVAKAAEAKGGVEAARSDLVSLLNATGDADAAANGATARAAVLSQPAAFDTLGAVLYPFLTTLGTAAAAERARSYGWGDSGSGTSFGAQLFGAPSSAVTVRR